MPSNESSLCKHRCAPILGLPERNTCFRRFSIIRKFKHMSHISRLFLHHSIPALLRNISQGRAERGMILLPTNPLEDRVCFRQWLELELRRLGRKGDERTENQDRVYIFEIAKQSKGYSQNVEQQVGPAYAGKVMRCQNFGSFRSLRGVVLPFDITMPPLPFFGEVGFR